MYYRVGKNEQKEFLKRVQSNQQKMKEWASHAPMNYRHKYDLVEAEMQRALGHFDRAMQFYEKAIKGARENQYLHEEALGYEFAGECCLARGLEDIAHYCLENARRLYERWGAKLKVKNLEDRYPELLDALQTGNDAVPPANLSYLDSSRLDLSSIIKASHAISSETNLKSLLNKIMNILMENAGADRGVVLLNHNDAWFIQAVGDFKTKQCGVLLKSPYNGKTDDKQGIPVPKSILNICIRAKETIVLNDVLQDKRCSDDAYYKKYKIKSALCIPLIFKGEFNGILYLENSLSHNVFTDSRVHTLQLLSTQFSISLENALLYNSLNELLEFEKLLSEISAAFVNIPAGKVDHQISRWLEKLVKFLHVDRGAIYEFKDGESTLAISHCFAASGMPKPLDVMKHHSGFVEMLLEGKMILLEKIENMPEGAEEERKYFRNEGIKSYVAVPLSIGGSFLGVIEFVSFKIAHSWQAEIIQRLRLLEEIFANVLDRKKNEERLQSRTTELIETAEKLKKLSSYLEEVREQERTHIAREIHDELGSALTVLKMDTSWFGKQLIDQPEVFKEKIREMRELIDSTVKTVQRISTELRPAILDTFGLFDAIKWYAEDFQSRKGIPCIVACYGEELENKKVDIVLFRILQEALTNVSRHAHATEVKVQVEMKNDFAILKISDDGKGITQSEIQSKNSLGLIGMRERVTFLNGNLEIEGKKGKGTTVNVTLPLRRSGVD
jgi:signal transduction histidine kinase